jgi:hypothetical protein
MQAFVEICPHGKTKKPHKMRLRLQVKNTIVQQPFHNGIGGHNKE